MSRTVKPTQVEARLLKKGDRLWFEYQEEGQDYITDKWVNFGKVKIQCDDRTSSREYEPKEMVRIHPRRKRVKKVQKVP